MSDEDHRRLGLVPDPKHLLLHLLACHLVQRPKRLVHQQQRRVERESSGDGDPLLHPAGQLPGVVLVELGELNQIEHLCRGASVVDAHDLQGQLHVLGDGPPVEKGGLLEHDAVVAVGSSSSRRLAVDGQIAARRRGEIPDQAQQGALSAPAGTDQGHELPELDLQRDVAQGLHLLGSLAEHFAHSLGIDHEPAHAIASSSCGRCGTSRRSTMETTPTKRTPTRAQMITVP